METGRLVKGIRAKEGAYDTIDNVTKFALDAGDYEEYEEWVEYTEDEIDMMTQMELVNEKAERQEAFVAEAPARLDTVETCITALTSAFGEVV